MRDIHSLPGPKNYFETFEDAITEIARVYPVTRREGSVGAWHWTVGDEIVAEAWIHPRKPGWWVRIKKP
jgi:hypothetical protein